jgi:NADH-quinone oxidoreductase subunit C
LLETIRQSPIQEYIVDVRGYAGEMTIEIAPANLLAVLRIFKEQFGFNYLADLTASDHYTDRKRFELSYNLVSIPHQQRLRISVFVEEADPEVDSATGLYRSADWYEREAWDMMGIRFRNHPDLRRIYLPEDFAYHPLRKEFPLLGIPGTIALPEKDGPKGYK